MGNSPLDLRSAWSLARVAEAFTSWALWRMLFIALCDSFGRFGKDLPSMVNPSVSRLGREQGFSPIRRKSKLLNEIS